MWVVIPEGSNFPLGHGIWPNELNASKKRPHVTHKNFWIPWECKTHMVVCDAVANRIQEEGA